MANQDTTIGSVTDLRSSLSGLFTDIVNGRVDARVARAANDVASTMIRSAIAQEKMYSRIEDKSTVVEFLREA